MKTQIMNIGIAVGDWFAPARDALTRFRDAVALKRREYDEGGAERAQLLSLPASHEEALAHLSQEVPALGRQWAEQHGPSLVAALGGSVDCGPDGVVRGVVRHLGLVDAVGVLSLPALAAIAPDLVRDGLARVIASAPAGPPMRDRVRLLAEVDERIERAREQHGTLVDAAGELGVALEELPENRARKIQAARAQERAEREARDTKPPRHA
jgi:hypothetical protein